MLLDRYPRFPRGYSAAWCYHCGHGFLSLARLPARYCSLACADTSGAAGAGGER